MPARVFLVSDPSTLASASLLLSVVANVLSGYLIEPITEQRSSFSVPLNGTAEHLLSAFLRAFDELRIAQARVGEDEAIR